jgi:hypothetical protein
VHGNALERDYGWDLESFGELYDVDKKVNVHGEFGIPFSKSFDSITSFSFNEIPSP